MLQEIFVLAVLISISEALQCASCTNIAQGQTCQNYVNCNQGERCYIRTVGIGQEALIDLGCTKETVCRSSAAASVYIGRRSISSVHCCAVDRCNSQLCSSGTQESHANQPCCESGQLSINLGSTTFNSHRSQGALKGVTVGTIGSPTVKACSQKVLITADFERIAHISTRRMLKIELQLSSDDRSGWLFNIGDSRSNNGWRGDSNDQKNDAEVQGVFPSITGYPSDRCMHIPRMMNIIDAISTAVHTVTLYVSNEHVRITNNEGLDYSVCSACLFALNGQADDGAENERVYIGLNRVVAGIYRSGHGVCSATLTWVCPWCD